MSARALEIKRTLQAMDAVAAEKWGAARKPESHRSQVGGDHYKNMGVQPWEAMEAWMSEEQFQGFLRGNVIKYIARCDAKGGKEDLLKAQHYLDKLIEKAGI